MINCPNCSAENADNANHCGNCGTKLQAGGGAKTMFGFAAVSQEDMKKAAEEARAAGELANKPKLQSPTLPTPSIPAPSLPAPSISPSSASNPAPTGAPKFNIPAPSSLSGAGSHGSEVPTQMTPAVESSDDDFGMGDTQLPADLAEATARLEAELARPSSHTTQPEPAVQPPANEILPVQAPNAPMSTSDFGGGFGGGGSGGGGFGGGGGGGSVRIRGEVRDPVKMIVLTYLTCGFYGLILIINVMNELNAGLGEDRYNVVRDLALGFITCGAYSIYLLWKIANDMEELQRQWGVEPKFAAPVLFVMNLFYVGPWALQTSLNNAWENGNPPS